jgi:CxxC-x17-CxxC domain-containing protein
MEDKQLACVDCGATFTFTAQEQTFYAEKGLTNEPKRCPNCRKARRNRQASKPRGGGRRGGGGGDRRAYAPAAGARREPGAAGGGGGPRRPMRERGSSPRPGFAVTCSRCGAETTVPFKPAPGRPVYCRDCYRSLS